jgi:hypothetical protein
LRAAQGFAVGADRDFAKVGASAAVGLNRHTFTRHAASSTGLTIGQSKRSAMDINQSLDPL